MPTNPSEVIVIATAKAKPGKEAELEAALSEAAAPTRAQPGCLQFILYRPSTDRRTIIALERWRSEADHQKHLAGAHVQRLVAKFGDILAEPPSIVPVEALPA